VTLAGFYQEWVWPAGGSGGIWGDVAGSLLWVVIAGIATYLVYKPLRRATDRWLKEHLHSAHEDLHRKLDQYHAEAKAERGELHRKVDHVIKYHPDIPAFPSRVHGTMGQGGLSADSLPSGSPIQRSEHLSADNPQGNARS
jgi:hypothetical protein